MIFVGSAAEGVFPSCTGLRRAAVLAAEET